MHNFKMTVFCSVMIFSCTEEALKDRSVDYKKALDRYQSGDFLESKRLANQILASSSNLEELAHTYYLKGFILHLQDSLGNAYNDYKTASGCFLKLSDDLNTSKLYNELGRLFYELDSYGPALQYFKLALTYARRASLNRHIANALYGAGQALERLGRYEESLKCFFEARKLEKEMGRLKQFIDVQLEIGIVQRMAGNYELAIEHCWKVMNAATGTKFEDLFKGKAYNNLGYIYFVLGDYYKAEEYLKASLKFTDRKDSFVAATYTNLGRVYNRLGNHTLASSHFKKSFELNQHKVNMEELMLTFDGIKSLPEVKSNSDSLMYYLDQFSTIATPLIASKEDLERKDLRYRLESLEIAENKNLELSSWKYWMAVGLMIVIFISLVITIALLKIQQHRFQKRKQRVRDQLLESLKKFNILE